MNAMMIVLQVVAAYYFPGFHTDPLRNEIHGKGHTSWEEVKSQREDDRPLWGYLHDDDPSVWHMKLDLAEDSGIDALIFDWYYFDEGPTLNGALEAYLEVAEDHDVQFAIMWANHEWAGWRNGTVSLDTYERILGRLRQLARHPKYLHIADKPYFSVYEIRNFVASGLVPPTDFHTALVVHEQPPVGRTWQELAQQFDSVTVYTWIHYVDVAENHADWWQKFQTHETWLRSLGTYHPNVSIGWNTREGKLHIDPSPAVIREALSSVLNDTNKLVTLNAFNEWVEGSAIEPNLESEYLVSTTIKKTLAGRR